MQPPEDNLGVSISVDLLYHMSCAADAVCTCFLFTILHIATFCCRLQQQVSCAESKQIPSLHKLVRTEFMLTIFGIVYGHADDSSLR